MPRVKGGPVAKNRRRKIMKMAKGFFGSKHRLYKTANEQVMRSLRYAYRDRRQNKRMFRRLWIERINAAAREHGLSYSKFMHGLKVAGVEVDRKMLSQIAILEPAAFKNLVITAKTGLGLKPSDKVTPVVTAEVKKAVKPVKTDKTEVVKETKVEETPVKKATPKKVDHSTKTVAELKALAKEQGITGYSTMKKDELLKVIK